MHQLESCGGLSTKEAEGARIPSGETGAEGSFDNEEEINQPKAYDSVEEGYVADVLQFLDEEETNKPDEKGDGTEISPQNSGVSAPFAPPNENSEIFEAYVKILNYLQATGQLPNSNQQKIQPSRLSEKDPSEQGTAETFSQANLMASVNGGEATQEELATLQSINAKAARIMRKKARRLARQSLNSPSPSPEFEGESMSHIAQQINPLGMPMTLETLQMCIQTFDTMMQASQPPAPAPPVQEVREEEVVSRRKKLREAMSQRRKDKHASRGMWLKREHPHLDRELLDKISDKHKDEEGLDFRQGTEATASLFHPFKSKEVSKYLWTQRLFGLSESGIFGEEEHEPNLKQLEACMMFVSGYDSKVFKINELSNIFSNYGNVSYALCFDEPKAAFVKYTVPETAAIAHKHLTKKSLAGHKVNIAQYAHFEGLDPCFLYCQPEIFVPRSSYRRFKQDIPKILNPISSCLHVCIFFPRKRRTVGDLEIVRFMKKSGVNPIQVKRDVTNTHINMWFVEYEKSTEAVLTLMKLHDLRFEDGRVRISFTKSTKQEMIDKVVDLSAPVQLVEELEPPLESQATAIVEPQPAGKKTPKSKRVKDKSEVKPEQEPQTSKAGDKKAAKVKSTTAQVSAKPAKIESKSEADGKQQKDVNKPKEIPLNSGVEQPISGARTSGKAAKPKGNNQKVKVPA